MDKLHEALDKMDPKKSDQTKQYSRKVEDLDGSHEEKVDLKVDTYDASVLFEKLKSGYVEHPERKPLWKITPETKKSDFMCYYTPVDQLVKECDKRIKPKPKVKKNPERKTPVQPQVKRGFFSAIGSFFSSIFSFFRRFWNFLFS